MIAAAGSGQRLGAGGPKAFVPLAGRAMVEWSIAACRAAPSVRSIVVACPPGHVHDLAGGDVGVVDGGATRAESVSNALEAVGTELVAIHDAARPLVTPELIEDVVATLVADPDAAGAIAATPVTDTIKQVGATRRKEPFDMWTEKVRLVDRVHRWSVSALGGADATGLPGRGAARGAGGRSRAIGSGDRRGDDGRGDGGQGPDPPFAGRRTSR